MQQRAADAEREFRQGLGRGAVRARFTCTYLGRRDNEHDNVFVASPLEWQGGAEWRSQALVTFRWQGPGGRWCNIWRDEGLVI